MELYKKHRPTSPKQMLGQADVIKQISAMLKSDTVPHTMLFTGPSGCGKTTLARILVKALKCGKADFTELNAANSKGIDMVRDLQKRVSLAPVTGKCRIWIIDECHQLTGPAQEAFLKLLEDTPKHVYFFLATTDPQKLKKTIRTRCTELKVKELTTATLKKLIIDTATKEDIEISEEVIDKVAEYSEGSARKCLVLLHQIIHIKDSEDQLNAIVDSSHERASIEVAKALLNPRTTWSDMGKLLKAVDAEPEGIRRLVLGYCNAILLGGGKMAPRAHLIITAFADNFFDSGKAGVTSACYEVVNGI